MKFSDTRPPVNDGSQYLRFTAGEIIGQMFAQGHEVMLPPGFGKGDNRSMKSRYARARLTVVMRPSDWATWTDDEKRRYRNALKRERQARR